MAKETIEEARERGYTAGQDALAAVLLKTLAPFLPDTEKASIQMAEELAATRHLLRQVCAKVGDNDWPDGLYTPDIIRKHLLDYLG